MENITHPQMDTAIRILRLETSKMGRPNAPCHHSSAGSSQRDLDTSILNELGLPSLEGGMSGSQKRKKKSRMSVAKRQKGKSLQKQNKGRLEDWVSTSGKTNSPSGQPNLYRADSGGGGKCIKRGSLEGLRPLSSLSFGLARPQPSRVYYLLFFLIKLSCNTDSSVSSNFSYSEIEPRIFHTPLTVLRSSLSWADPLQQEIVIHSSVLAWIIPKTEEPGGLQSMGSQKVYTTEHTHTHTHTHTIVLVAQSCLILCDPMHYTPPASSVHRILQAGILEWILGEYQGSHSLLQAIFLTQGLNLGVLDCKQIIYHLSHQEILHTQ